MFVLLIVVVVLVWVLLSQLQALRARVDRLERELETRALAPEHTPESAAPSIPTRPAPGVPSLATSPVPAAPTAASAPPGAVMAPEPAAGPGSAGAAMSAPSPTARPTRPAPPSFSATDLEQWVGGIWLQNAGAVLVLLGAFFMILWGFRTGRLGAPALVVAGVALGLGLVWRGDRAARTVPAFGHSLIGVGLGVVYLSVYLGHFLLHAFGPLVAVPMLVVVALGTLWVGLRYRVASIATLGVIGAFVPLVLPSWAPPYGFHFPPGPLLFYLAFVNAAVLAMVFAAGWSGLALTTLVLSAVAWISGDPRGGWGWPVQLGLSAVFTGLAFAPLPRLTAVAGRVRNIDQLLVAAAPLCYLAASSPFFAATGVRLVAVLLLSLAALQLAAAMWVEARRPERDLWRPLTGAAVLYITIALERAFGGELTPLAWTLEGVVLVVLGARERGGWLRLCGSIVAGLGLAWLALGLAATAPGPGAAPVLRPDALRALICIIATLFAARTLSRARSRLTPGEGMTPEAWMAAGQFLLALWLGREAAVFTRQLADSGAVRDRETLNLALRGMLWMGQALMLVVVARHRGQSPRRAMASLMAFAATVVTLLAVSRGDDGRGIPFAHATAVLPAFTVLYAALAAVSLARRRAELEPWELRAPEAWALAAMVTLLPWSAIESGHLARALLQLPPGAQDTGGLRTLRAALTSGAWMLEAVAVLTLGWIRRSAFLRWSALALVGITLLKFTFVDLRNVDVFWRFLTAVAVGAVLLAISYVYQARLSRAVREPPAA